MESSIETLSKLAYLFFVGLIHLYQIVLSPILGGNCRFYPSCSEYCKECFEKYDAVTSFCLTAKRLMKCYPLGPSGFDPVPERKK